MSAKPQHWAAIDAHLDVLGALTKTLEQARNDRAQLLRALQPFAQAFAKLPDDVKSNGRHLVRGGYYDDRWAKTVVLIGDGRLTDADFAIAAKVVAEQSGKPGAAE